MNILLINWQDRTNPQAGGAEIHIHEIFGRIARMGHKVTLLCNRQKGSARTEMMDGIRIIRVGNRFNTNYLTPGAYYKLRKNEEFDVVVEGMNKLPYFTPLYVKEPILVIVHHLFGATAFREAVFPAALYVTSFEKMIPSFYRKQLFEAISESTRQDLLQRGVEDDRIRIVHCGIDHDVYNRMEEVRKSPFPHILSIGRLKKYKSIDHIIRAMPDILGQVPGTRLTIVGEGDYKGKLVGEVERLGLEESVDFTGFISHADKLDFMRKAHVMVNPSPKEGWGLTVVETSACGTVVCATDAPGLRDSVKHGETGFLFEYGNLHDFVDKVVRVLKDHGMRAEMEKRATEWAANFSWDGAAEDTLEIIRDSIIRHAHSRDIRAKKRSG